jgi:hypothetical protein
MHETPTADGGDFWIAAAVAGLEQSVFVEIVQRQLHQIRVSRLAKLLAKHLDQIIDAALTVACPPNCRRRLVEPARHVPLLVIEQ